MNKTTENKNKEQIMSDPNENKPGYKKTKLGWIPHDWEIFYISDNITILLSNVDKHIRNNEKKVFLCNYTDVYYNEYITEELNFPIGTAKDREIEKFKLKKGDVIITKDSEDRSDIAVPAYVKDNVDDLICGYHLAILRVNGNIDGRFFPKLIQFDKINHFFQRRANGITRFGLTKETIEKTLIYLPPPRTTKNRPDPLHLGPGHRAYRKTDRKKQRLKKGLMQKLLSGKVRFPEFISKLKEYRICDLVKEVDRRIDWDDNAKYNLLSIKRRSEGLFFRESKYGYEIKTKGFKKARTGDFLISKMQIVHGASGLVTEEFDGMMISNSYIALIPRNNNKLSIEFFNYLSQTPYFYHLTYLASYGVHIEKMTFNLNLFLKSRIKIPFEIEEQQAIVNVLDKINNEIIILNKQLEYLKQQKKGLMQQLLTGKIIVKTN